MASNQRNGRSTARGKWTLLGVMSLFFVGVLLLELHDCNEMFV
jgi:hypothetical protein